MGYGVLIACVLLGLFFYAPFMGNNAKEQKEGFKGFLMVYIGLPLLIGLGLLIVGGIPFLIMKSLVY